MSTTTQLTPRPIIAPRPAKVRLLHRMENSIEEIDQLLRQTEEKRQADEQKQLALAESRRHEQLRQEGEQRIAAANVLNGHLLMVEIMMSSLVHRYAHQVYTTIEQRGLLRHNIKRQANQLRSVASDLISRCTAHDLAYVHQYTHDIYPSLVSAYLEAGGTITIKLQAEFYKQHDQRIKLIYFATKNALDKMRLSPSDLMTDIFMITMLTQTGIEFYNLIGQKTDKLMQGYGRITRVKSNHNEKMLCAARELLRLFGCLDQMPEEIARHPRALTFQFQSELTDIGLLNTIEQSLISLRMDYIEFIIASLRLKLNDGSLSLTDIRTLVARVGTIANVRRLLTEIADIPLPQSDGWDVIDLAQSLPDSAAESALATFRRLCIDNHVLLPTPEDEQTVRLRELRQEARSNNGMLPMGTLKNLFAQAGTKKAVQELLAKGGQELELTAKWLRGVKVGELK